MPSNPKNTVSTVIPGPRVRILLPPGKSLRTLGPAEQTRLRIVMLVKASERLL